MMEKMVPLWDAARNDKVKFIKAGINYTHKQGH